MSSKGMIQRNGEGSRRCCSLRRGRSDFTRQREQQQQESSTMTSVPCSSLQNSARRYWKEKGRMSRNMKRRPGKDVMFVLAGTVAVAAVSSARMNGVEAFVSSSSGVVPRRTSTYVVDGRILVTQPRRTTSSSPPSLTIARESTSASMPDDERNGGDNFAGMGRSSMLDSGSFVSFDENSLTTTSEQAMSRNTKSRTLSSTTSGIRYGPPPTATSSVPPESSKNGGNSNKSLLERLTSLSTIASALCVLDCTVLPLITIALPLLGLTAAGSSALAHQLHHLGHTLALYFVLPVGTFTTTVAYANHRSILKCLPGILGLLLIYLSNAGGAAMHLHTTTVMGDMSGGLNPLVQMLPHDVLHAVGDGESWVHRVVNVLGCALMLGGNWWSKRSAASGEDGSGEGGGACFVPGCGRIECEVDGEGAVEGVEEISFFRVERPNVEQ